MSNIYQQEARYTFRVKESGTENPPHIALEPFDGEISLFKDSGAHLFFNLPAGTTLEKAHEIATFMNDNLRELGCFRLG